MPPLLPENALDQVNCLDLDSRGYYAFDQAIKG